MAALQTRGKLEAESQNVEATPAKSSAATPESDDSHLTPEAKAKQPFVDENPPLPQTYDVDIIRALAQDPFRIFVYWEVSDQSITALTQYFSAKTAGSFKLALKLIDRDGRVPARIDVEKQGSYWMTVSPSRDYEFELEACSDQHEEIPLLRSNRVHTPSANISRVTSDEAEYRSSSRDFAELLRESGLGERAFDSESTTDHAIALRAEDVTRMSALASSSYSSSAREKLTKTIED